MQPQQLVAHILLDTAGLHRLEATEATQAPEGTGLSLWQASGRESFCYIVSEVPAQVSTTKSQQDDKGQVFLPKPGTL